VISARHFNRGETFQAGGAAPPDDANRARHRTHHDGFSLDEMPAKFDAGHQSAGGDAGGGKQAIAPHHILD
jgi:hypothetical protein